MLAYHERHKGCAIEFGKETRSIGLASRSRNFAGNEMQTRREEFPPQVIGAGGIPALKITT